MTGAQYFSKLLKRSGIDTVFGIPSYVGMELINAFDDEGMKIILNTHEQNAAHMAEGYYLATGKTPVLSIAIGPGLTNAMTGITQAFVESVPMIVVAGRANPVWWGRNEYHSQSGIGRNLNESQMIQSCTKAVYYPDSNTSLPQILIDAIRTANSGRPGPVYLSIPVELQKSEVKFPVPSKSSLINRTNSLSASQDQINELKDLWEKSKNPVIMLGPEVRDVREKDLVNLLQDNCPYFTGYGAKGSVPLMPNYLGTAWLSNSSHIKQTLKKADLLLVLGDYLTHFTGRLLGSYFQKLPIVQISKYQQELGRAFDLKLGIHANVGSLIKPLSLLKNPWDHGVTADMVDESKYSTRSVIRQLGDLAPTNAVFFADVGNAGYCAITDLILQAGQSFYTTGKLGSCGWSVPTAIGHSFAKPNRPVFSIVGDLALNMNAQELLTAGANKQANTFLVFNNRTLQNITQDQIEEAGKAIQADIPPVNYKSLARAYGLDYYRVDSVLSLKTFFTSVDVFKSTNLVEIILDPNDRPIKED